MATYDLFISYRRKDTARVRPLVEALRSQGVSIWFDQTDIDDFAPITDRIRDDLANSKALFAWYNITVLLDECVGFQILDFAGFKLILTSDITKSTRATLRFRGMLSTIASHATVGTVFVPESSRA